MRRENTNSGEREREGESGEGEEELTTRHQNRASILCVEDGPNANEFLRASNTSSPSPLMMASPQQFLSATHFHSPRQSSTEIGKKAWLFAKLQPGRARKRINAT